jgi:hypothetical protein
MMIDPTLVIVQNQLEVTAQVPKVPTKSYIRHTLQPKGKATF